VHLYITIEKYTNNLLKDLLLVVIFL